MKIIKSRTIIIKINKNNNNNKTNNNIKFKKVFTNNQCKIFNQLIIKTILAKNSHKI